MSGKSDDKQSRLLYSTALRDIRAIRRRSYQDALHVACATVADAGAIVSWNFKHIVNIDRIHGYNSINAMNGYRILEIYSPMEMSDAEKD